MTNIQFPFHASPANRALQRTKPYRWLAIFLLFSLCLTYSSLVAKSSEPLTAGPLYASILPTARGTTPGRLVSAFANILNSGSSTALSCGITSPDTNSTFIFQTTNAENQLVGIANQRVDIAPGAVQNFAFFLTPINATTEFQEIEFEFDCSNTAPAKITKGLNSFTYDVIDGPMPDWLMIIASASYNGYIDVPGERGNGYAFVSVINIGDRTAGARLYGGAGSIGNFIPNFPAQFHGCSLDARSECLGGDISLTFGLPLVFDSNGIATARIRVAGNGMIADDPAINRLQIFGWGSGRPNQIVVVGATSIALRTIPVLSP